MKKEKAGLVTALVFALSGCVLFFLSEYNYQIFSVVTMAFGAYGFGHLMFAFWRWMLQEPKKGEDKPLPSGIQFTNISPLQSSEPSLRTSASHIRAK